MPHSVDTAAPNLNDFNEQLIFGILDHNCYGLWSYSSMVPPNPGPRLLRLARAIVQHRSQHLAGAPEWKTVIIHPIPKVKPPLSLTDYRPISVVPILSRILKRLAVKGYLYPAIRLPMQGGWTGPRPVRIPLHWFDDFGPHWSAAKDYLPVAKQRICGPVHTGFLEGIRLRETSDTRAKKLEPLQPAASIWFKIWGALILVNKISIFPGKFQWNFDFSCNFPQKFRFF